MNNPPDSGQYCPLCKSNACEPFFENAVRQYIRCCWCQLIFVPSKYWLSEQDERAEYDLHENMPNDPGYRSFLSRLTTPLLKMLPDHQHGLDFGCGPGPALATMLKEHGHHVELYDPFYANTPSTLDRKYDFICATEVVEHLRDPSQIFMSLFSLIKEGGWLAIMTKLVNENNTFGDWHYIRDMTHICFYHPKTFSYLSKRFNADLIFEGNDVILLKKKVD